MTSELEALTLSGLALNDQASFIIEALTFTPAQKKPNWATNNDADGDALVREAHYTNATLEATIRVMPQSTAAAGREKLGELTNALQACERTEGGATLLWTPNSSSTEYTGYALLGEYSEIPTDVQGDMAGWFLKSPIVKVKLTLRPFFKTAERTVLEPAESSAAPSQTKYVGGIKGDVAAEARLILKDSVSTLKNRRYAEFGRDMVTSEENPAVLITAASLVTEGFSGEAKTRSGAYSEEKVKRATAISSPTTMCGTGRITHTGSYAIYLRVYTASETARFRIAFRNGDGALVSREWQEAPVIEGFSDISMGEVFFDEVELGTQTSEIRVEIKSTGAVIPVDVNYLQMVPTERGSCRAVGLAHNEPTNLLAYDEFNQTAGNLEGKELGGPGVIKWAEAEKTGENGFKVNATSHVAERAKVSDATLLAGSYALAGEGKYTTAQVNCELSASTALPSEEGFRMGVLGRYGSTEKWLMATLIYLPEIRVGDKVEQRKGLYLAVYMRNGTTPTLLDKVYWQPASSDPRRAISSVPIQLNVTADGIWEAKLDNSVSISGQSSVLAAGGALETGKIGMFDAWSSATANTRTYDNFNALGAESAAVVCYPVHKWSSAQMEYCDRTPPAPTTGNPSTAGHGSTWQPEGDNGAINRIVVRMRRNNIETEVDDHVTDKHTMEVRAVERYLVPR